MFFFFKRKTACEMPISDWSSDVCSSDLRAGRIGAGVNPLGGNWVGDDEGAGDGGPGIRIIELEYEVIAGRGGAGLLKHRLFMTSRVSRRTLDHDPADDKIGRASCRERVCQYV